MRRSGIARFQELNHFNSSKATTNSQPPSRSGGAAVGQPRAPTVRELHAALDSYGEESRVTARVDQAGATGSSRSFPIPQNKQPTKPDG